MAWLLALCAELAVWDHPAAPGWLAALSPLEKLAQVRFSQYCTRLAVPVRRGTHQQSAFALSLVLDACVPIGDTPLRDLVASTAHRLFVGDTGTNLAREPSAADFLSPMLAQSELLSQVLQPSAFAAWLEGFAPHCFSGLEPVCVVDPANPQLVHWAGLNLSRSWMLTRIATTLPQNSRLRETLENSARRHKEAGLPLATHEDYMVSHWVPTFAVRLLTGPPAADAGSFSAIGGVARLQVSAPTR